MTKLVQIGPETTVVPSPVPSPPDIGAVDAMAEGELDDGLVCKQGVTWIRAFILHYYRVSHSI